MLHPAPGSRRRRRRRRWPWVVLVLLVLPGAVGGYLLYRENQAAQRRADQRHVAESFVAAWRRSDYGTMWTLLTPHARRRHHRAEFIAAYRGASTAATARSVRPGAPVRLRDDLFRVPVVVRTRLFGTLRGPRLLPLSGSGDRLGVVWNPRLVFPLLRRGERLYRAAVSPGPPAPILAANGTPLSSPAGVIRPGAPQGTLGALRQAYRRRLHGRAGATLYAGARVLRRVPAIHARPLRTTLVPRLQAAATAALGARYGGIAVLRPRDGGVLALAGIATSAPQPPGSTFKIITTTAALAAGVAGPDTSFAVARGVTIEGRTLANARGEACGGTLARAFAVSCNSVFAPLGARVGARRLVAMAQRFGFNEPPPIPFAARSTIPSAATIGDALAVAASAIGQGRVTATPLALASVAAAIGTGGLRVRPRIAADAPPQARRVAPAAVVAEVAAMMRAVVASGTGTAAQIPGVTVAGKTGTAELTSAAPTAPSNPKDSDAWFVAYAPAERPTIAVAVLLVRAGFGGDTAAPVARQVLRAALGR